MNRMQIVALDDQALKRIIAVFDNAQGAYANELRWAYIELSRRLEAIADHQEAGA